MSIKKKKQIRLYNEAACGFVAARKKTDDNWQCFSVIMRVYLSVYVCIYICICMLPFRGTSILKTYASRQMLAMVVEHIFFLRYASRPRSRNVQSVPQ